MSINKGRKYIVNLTIETLSGIASDVDIIKLKPQNGITFTPAQIKVKDITTNVSHFPSGTDLGQEIEIACTDFIKQNTIIDIYNQNDTIIGKLSFSRNDKEYKMPIRIVLLLRENHEATDRKAIATHLTTHPESDFLGESDIESCMKWLEIYMNQNAFNQAFIKTEMERENDNVKIRQVAINEQEWKNKGLIDNTTGQFVSTDDLLPEILDLYKQQVEKKTGFFKGIVVFITNLRCGTSITGKGQVNIIDDRNCVLFKYIGPTRADGNVKMSTYVHEIGHVLSLVHPFQAFDRDIILNLGEQIAKFDKYLQDNTIPQSERDARWVANKDSYKKANRQCYLYSRNKHLFGRNDSNNEERTGITKCMFMDYLLPKDQRVFTQWQWKTMQESVKRYFSNK